MRLVRELNVKCELVKRGLVIEIKCEGLEIEKKCKLRTLNVMGDSTYHIFPFELKYLIDCLSRLKISYTSDNVRMDHRTTLEMKKNYELRDYQLRILDEFHRRDNRATILMPTGSGKTLIALEAARRLGLKTVIIVPTLALLEQWMFRVSDLLSVKEDKIGVWGGGLKRVGEVTIATYAGASRVVFLDKYMDQFGFVIFDEVHRIENPNYLEIAYRLTAPFRMGLTATLDKQTYYDRQLDYVIGEIIEGPSITELELAGWIPGFDYQAIPVELTETEKKLLRGRRGKGVLKREMKRKLIYLSSTKLEVLERLLLRHKNDRVIVFTRHIESAREIGKIFGIPMITSTVAPKERSAILHMFSKGELTKIVTAEALDEGVDVPEVNVAIIVSGRGSNRQLIQRIGRALRGVGGSKVKIYEIYTKGVRDEALFRRRQ